MCGHNNSLRGSCFLFRGHFRHSASWPRGMWERLRLTLRYIKDINSEPLCVCVRDCASIWHVCSDVENVLPSIQRRHLFLDLRLMLGEWGGHKAGNCSSKWAGLHTHLGSVKFQLLPAGVHLHWWLRLCCFESVHGPRLKSSSVDLLLWIWMCWSFTFNRLTSWGYHQHLSTCPFLVWRAAALSRRINYACCGKMLQPM